MASPDTSEARENEPAAELLASAFLSVATPLAIIDRDGKLVVANAAFSRSLRQGDRTLEGRRFWDLVAGGGGGAAVAAEGHMARGATPFEFDARMELGDGETALMGFTMNALAQPGFDGFRVLSPRERPAPVGAGRRDLGEAATPEPIVVGSLIQLAGLERLKVSLGELWPEQAERSMADAEAVLRRRLGPADWFERTEGPGFVIGFAGGREGEAASTAAAIAREIGRRAGGGETSAGPWVTAITQSVSLGPAETAEGRPRPAVLARRLEGARTDAERRARGQLAIALSAAALEREQLFGPFGAAVPMIFAGLPERVQDRIDVARAALPALGDTGVLLDLLKLRLVADSMAGDLGAGRSCIYLLPVEFAVLADGGRRERFLEACRSLPEDGRRSLVLVVSDLPANPEPERLTEMVGTLRGLGHQVGLAFDDGDLTPTDPGRYGIGFLALTAETVLAMARLSRPRLAAMIQDLRASNTRLVVRQVHGEAERVAVTGIGAALTSFAAAPSVKVAVGSAGGTVDSITPAAFAAAIASAPVSCTITDIRKPDNPIASCNPVFTDITGYTPEEVIGRNWRFLHGQGTDRQVLAELRDAAEFGVAIRREVLLYRKDGAPFRADLVVSPVHDEAGALVSLVVLMTDVTALRREEASRRALDSLLADLAETVPGYFFQRVVTGDGRLDYTYVSPSFHRLVGVTADDPDGGSPNRWIHPEDLASVSREVLKARDELKPFSVECRLIARSGQIRWIRSTARPVRGAGGAVVWNGVAVDVTSEKTAEVQLSYLAGHDPLTGLLNRQTFRGQLAMHVAAARGDGGGFAVLSVDLADFQAINDGFGATVGDGVLQTVADRIAKFDGTSLVARVGGNEFAMVLDGVDSDLAALARARALGEAIANPIDINAQRITIYCYMGLALYPAHAADLAAGGGGDAGALTQAVGIALYSAKRAGPGSRQIYSPDSDDRIRDRAILQQSLFEAFEKKQFDLHYQPVVDLKSGRILGAEALIRWRHPELGLQRPDQFIPLAEKMGLIVPLGAWVLEEVILRLGEWEARGLGRPRIAVNVAAAQLQHPDALAQIRARVLVNRSNATQIEIELTESEFIDPTPRMLENLAALRDLGVTVAIDDFGTGYSSFQYLRSLPIDKIKIDKSFVSRMAEESGDEAIVRGMIAIGRDLGLTVVVEGVETADQRDILVREGCRIGQGYFYSMPVNADDFAWMLAERVTLPVPKPATGTKTANGRPSTAGRLHSNVAAPASLTAPPGA